MTPGRQPPAATEPTRLLPAVLGTAAQPRPVTELVVGALGGEGVGPALTAAALEVLDAVAAVHGIKVRVDHGPAVMGRALAPDVRDWVADVFAAGGAVLAGAVGGRFVYELRHEFDLFCKLVPVRPWDVLLPQSFFRAGHLAAVDLVLVRENVAGLYQGQAQRSGSHVEHRFAYSAEQIERIVAVAARVARTRRGRLTVVVKDGGLPELSALWREAAAAACAPEGIEPDFADVDLFAYRLLQAPAELDVIVAANLYGDILADLTALLVGGRGVSFSGNYAPAGAAVYQTNHGAAHDLAGTDRANPVGQLSALAMLLHESAGEPAAARSVLRAIDTVWRAGFRTADVAGPGDRVVGTRELTARIAAAVTAEDPDA